MEEDLEYIKIKEEIRKDGYEEIELLRKEKVKKERIFAIVGIIGFLCFLMPIIFMAIMNNGFLGFIMFLLICSIMIIAILIVVISLVKGNSHDKMRVMYKEKIIKKFVEKLFEGAIFDTYKGISEQQYNRQVYKEHYDIYSSEDLVEKNGLAFSEVTTYRESTDKDGHTTKTTVFHGIAGKYEIKNAGLENITVLRNYFLNSKGNVKMDSSEFEKAFDVYSENNIYAMKFLTTFIMNELIDLKTNKGINFEFAIKDNVLYFRINEMGSLFEVDIHKDILESKETYRAYSVLKSIITVIEFIEERASDMQ